MGGAYYSINLNIYHYAGLNPIKLIDPNGNESIAPAGFWEAAGITESGIRNKINQVSKKVTATGMHILAGPDMKDLRAGDPGISGVGAAGTFLKVLKSKGFRAALTSLFKRIVSKFRGGLPKGLKINDALQGKHIIGSKTYQGGTRSILTHKDPQSLLKEFAGKGKSLSPSKARIDFGQVIGKFYDKTTGKYLNTTRGMIHHGKKGAHIVPARPASLNK